MKKSKEIQKLISKEMRAQGYTFYRLAKAMGCSPRAVSYWDVGKRAITLDMADKALKVLGITVEIGKEQRKD